MKNKPAAKRLEREFWTKAAVVIILIGIVAWFLFELNRSTPVVNPDEVYNFGYYRARVTAVLFDDASPHEEERFEGLRSGRQEIELELLNGPHKGETFQIENYLSPFANVDVTTGMTIIVRYQDYGNGNISVLVYNYNRAVIVGVLALILAVLLVVIGGKKGLMALLGLVFTLLCLWFLLIPLVMRGYNMLLTTIAIVAISTAVCLLMLAGFTRKAYSAILGCVMGVTVAGLFTWIASLITPLSGLNMLDAERLGYYATEGGMKVSGLFVCGVLIASLGAVMDVAMSISSAVNELVELNPELPTRQVFRSGMNIGKDAMGTMANTLILALIGSSLNTFILTHAYEIPFSQLFNSDFIVIELVQGIAGTIGIVLTVPFVAFISSQMMSTHGRKAAGSR